MLVAMSMLISIRAGQMLSVLFNILEHRHLKETGKRVPLSQYGGYPGAVVSRNDFGTDWKSVTSEEMNEESLIYEGSSEIQRPPPVVEPKSRYNPLIQQHSNEV